MQNLHIPDQIISDRSGNGQVKSLFYANGLLITVTVILLFGLTMLYSTSYNTAGTKYFYNQLMWTAIGLTAGGMAFVFGHKRVAEMSILFAVITVILLAIADFCFPAIKGAHRWIQLRKIGLPINIQPSEFAKLVVALYFSRYCAQNTRYINDLLKRRGPLPALMICGIVIMFVLIGKDLGTTLLLLMATGIILFASGMRMLYLLPPIILGIPTLIYVISKFDRERWSRMTTFLNPESLARTEGYQLWNSLLALGSGKWFGIGFMESRLKAKYLPEAHTDFILSIVGEELGLISLVLVMLAYLCFAYFALKISMNSRTRQGMLLGLSLTSIITLQAIINIGVVSGGIPTKGMPAPFISYGGSNLLMALIAVGLLLSIAVETASPGFSDELLETVKSRIPFLKRNG
ncbi:MAG: cell division protein FtsW [Lentisphaerae bacterium]|nr:cell division protein FtsW [Lentisphaerota bacterium]MCP4103707.1 cell division protein FtsW [Lentisphaerota bacterium]